MMLLVGCYFVFIVVVVLLGTTTTTPTQNGVSSDHGTNDTENVRLVDSV